MEKVIFLYSGEGTRSSESGFALAKSSPRWVEINRILTEKLSLSLEEMCEDTDIHRSPLSPVITVATEICLADIWQRWGYKPDVVIGHSIGELAAAYQAGLYTLEEILLLTHQIGTVAGSIDGMMAHGVLSEEEISFLSVSLSSRNFYVEDKIHVTVSGSRTEIIQFLKENRGFTEMSPPHPWHNPVYEASVAELEPVVSQDVAEAIFVSGVTARFEDCLAPSHWRSWMTRPVNLIDSIGAIKARFPHEKVQVIEIGFHPVLEKCCEILDEYSYCSSLFRGKDEFSWIFSQRKKIKGTFLTELRACVDGFRPGLDFNSPLAYQDFTSLTFVEFATLLEPYFPGLAPQDFYRYKSISQLVEQFGLSTAVKERQARHYLRNRVVVSGMSCRFPSSVETIGQYWDMLNGGEDQVRADEQRGDFEAGFLDSVVSRFDHHYFGISEAESKTMDPQQILALELTELLWSDAGIDPRTLDRSRVGVYIGAWNEEYRGNRDSVYYPTGTNPSIIASRISHHYDLRGPSWVVNSACSSSLVALHYACKDIEAGRVDYAIAGGVNMILGNEFSHSMRDSGFLSRDQRCKTFDDSANGYVRAEGGGLVLLVNKELVEQYYAEILGSSINQNGSRTQVITAPHPEAQEELILDACRDANVSPTEIGYVECHGTGTKLGDPIEISALQNTVARNRETLCYLGSVKSNMGHLESAAGVAGLLKAILVVNHELIPPNLHFKVPNQFIDFTSYKLQVVDRQTPFDSGKPVGVSSFGYGGANAHVVLQGAESASKKEIGEIEVPFDRDRAVLLKDYYQLGSGAKQKSSTAAFGSGGVADMRELVIQTFFELTGINDIAPDVALTDQGLDSLSATDFVSTLQQHLGLELDADLLFDYPLIDPLVVFLSQKKQESGEVEAPFKIKNRADLVLLVAELFYELTNIKEIDPDVELTDQGLDSLSATELLTQLEQKLKVTIDSDILFEQPLVDQFVDEIYRQLQQEAV